MSESSELLLDLVAAMSIALAGGWLATRIGLPAIAGYVAAGTIISPFTPGFVGDAERLRLIADIGVVLLMFGIGVQFSLRDLVAVGPRISAAGTAQVIAVAALGSAALIAAGLGGEESLFLGSAVAISSSTLVVKLIADRGETTTRLGRVVIAWAVVQDIAAVVMVAMLIPIAEGGDLAVSVSLAALKAAAFVGAMLVIGLRVVPAVLGRVADTGSRELFVLAVAALALGTALASDRVGLSLALGAFIAGLVVSEADLSHRVLGDLLPARDVFAVFFFVSVGMLIDPEIIRDELGIFLLLLALAVPFKAAVTYAAARSAGENHRTSYLGAGILAQGGEFSFILAGLGLDEGAISDSAFSAVVAATAVSLVLSPLIVTGMRALADRERRPAPAPEHAVAYRPGRHAVVAGYGATGRVVLSALRPRFDAVVVDQDARAFRGLDDPGVRTIAGDASNDLIIEQMDLQDCRVLIVTIGDPFATRLLVERAREVNPGIDIIARAATEGEASKLRTAGAGEAVVANREIALEMIRHSLHRFGVDQRQALAVVQRLRQTLGREL